MRNTDTPPRRVTDADRSAVSEFARESEQAVLVILFSDIAGSTKLKERMPAAKYQELRREHDARLLEIIAREGGGTPIKHTGDGILAAFLSPDVAVERALEMQRAMRDHELAVRIGINMGSVTVEPSVGTDADLFGHNVDWAARAEALAHPGHICVTRPVYEDASRHLHSGICSWKDHGEYVVKDGETPLYIWEPHDASVTPMGSLRGHRLYGDHPTVWNVPLRRNRNFTGREEILTEVYESLRANDPAALTQTEAIHGLGGIGKTQIAAEYAHRYAGDYDCVWWVAAADDAARPAEYAGLARALDLPERDAREQDTVVAAVRDWLRTHGRWLLILDNAPEAESIHDLLPDGNSGHVIITSRSAVWRDVARPVSVDTWPRDESVRFLRARTGREDDEHAGELAAELGDLPLALEQAAAYMHVAAISYEAYLDRYRRSRQALLARSAPRDHPEAVATTWQVSMDRLREECPAAVDLLNVCAFLAPDDIAREWIVDAAEHLPEPLASVVGDPVDLDDVVAALRRYSLVKVEEDALSVHRLVQEVVRDGMADDARRSWWECAVSLVYAAIPPGDIHTTPEAWSAADQLLPHARSVTAPGPGSAPEQVGHILNQAGLYLYVRAQFDEARMVFGNAFRAAEAAYGPNHPEVAVYINNLGNVLQEQNDLDGARCHYERALRIDEAAYGPDDPRVAMRASNLGSVLWAQGDPRGASGHIERALRIDEAAYGRDHASVAIRVNMLGLLMRAQGDLDGARAHVERALRIDEAIYGLDHPTVGTRVSSLGKSFWIKAMLAARGPDTSGRSASRNAPTVPTTRLLRPASTTWGGHFAHRGIWTAHETTWPALYAYSSSSWAPTIRAQ
jgi:class 3 adenylate cyclase/tetratricopeptide (TPR) repeat protein